MAASLPKDAKLAESAWSQGPREDYSAGLRWSVFLHFALIALVLLKSIVFPGRAVPFIPTLRVDIVGLPDVLKKDLAGLPKTSGSLDQIQKALDKADQELKQAKEQAKKQEVALKKADKNVEKARSDEMVLKPKPVSETKAREKKLRGALDRIKALEKIASEVSAKPQAQRGVLIKGNAISHGTSLSGDAKESASASYYDALRSRLQENWALPVWLARQNLSAQVQIFVDARGRLRSFKFLKFSGNAQFDNFVKQSLNESQPYPSPPEELTSSVLVDGILVGFPL